MSSIPTPDIPSQNAFLTALLTSLSAIAAQAPPSRATPSSSTAFPQAARAHLQTLHVLFPHCLLDALDLLDRGLVTRLVIQPGRSAAPDPNANPKPNLNLNPNPEIQRIEYHVRSARRAPHFHSHPSSSIESYHVHLAAWNCSCAAFAFAAYTGPRDAPGSGELRCAQTAGSASDIAVDAGLSFGRIGGLAREKGGMPPTCKHLLACVLAEACPGFFGPREGINGDGNGNKGEERWMGERGGAGVVEKVVSLEEAAGWAGSGGGF